MDLELELRMLFGDAGEQRAELGLVLAGDQREDVARLGEQAVDDRGGDRVEARPARDGVAADEAEVGAALDLQPVDADRSRRDRDAARRDAVAASSIACAFAAASASGS